MNNISNITWITGLSCIGKSTLLSKLCEKHDLTYVQSDLLRNQLIEQNPVILENIQEIIGHQVSCWPLCLNDLPYLYKSIDIFFNVQKYISSVFLPFLIETLKKEPHKIMLVEVSPYILHYAQRNERIIFLTLTKSIHIERIIKKTGCNITDANLLYLFFLNVLSRIDNYLFFDKILDIENIIELFQGGNNADSHNWTK
ncbi:MAG: hypothetical protein ACXVED_20960 [Bacteroidia bacterium]